MRSTRLAARAAPLVLLALAGCGGPTDLDGERAEVVVPPPAPGDLPPEPGDAERIVGADGALLESTERVNGLVLPRGLEVVADEDRRHVYRTRSPVRLVIDYLGPRLTTAEVERADRGAVTYRNATAVRAGSSGPRMDVSVSPTSGAYTRVEIVLAPAEALAAPSEDEVRARLEALATSGE